MIGGYTGGVAVMSILFGALFLSAFAWAEFVSSTRHPNVDYKNYESHLLKDGEQKAFNTPVRIAARFGTVNLPETTEWSDLQLRTYFKHMRDARSERWNRNPLFPRRNAWMYPDDGCYVRAAIGTRNISSQGGTFPGRVFAFGNLKAETVNTQSGHVWWWYHVALIVQVGGEYFVLDPSIEVERPLALKEWLDRMGEAQNIRVAICRSGTSSPKESCDRISDGKEEWALGTQQYFLSAEWNRLLRLQRIPENELGDSPPWTR